MYQCYSFSIFKMADDSSVSIKTRYGLDCPEIEPRWGRDFTHPSKPAQGPPASHTTITGSFSRVKQAKRGVDHTPPSNAQVKGKTELYLYNPLCLYGRLQGEIFIFNVYLAAEIASVKVQILIAI